mgnify:CR=1 FL=1
MTNIWIVNGEYVSVAGLMGIHLGYISKGFDISKYQVEYLSSKEIHQQAEDFYKKIKRYPGNYYYKKMIIDSMPSEIESIIDQIQIALQNSTYDSKMDAPIIEWLDKNVELLDQYENSKSLDDNGATRLLDW